MAVFNVIDHTEIASGGAASWAASSISSSYAHLLIKVQERNDNGGAGRYPTIRLGNSGIDTGSNYSTTYAYSRTSSSVASGRESTSYIPLYYGSDDNDTSNTYSALEVWIPNYSNTSNYKQTWSRIVAPSASGSDYNWGMGFQAGLWKSNSAVTDVQVLAWNSGGGAKHMQYSTFTLYGINAA